MFTRLFSRHSVANAASVRVFIAAVGALLIAGCATTSAPNARIDYDKKTDFAVYRTFGFPKETGTDRGGFMGMPPTGRAIKTAVEAS